MRPSIRWLASGTVLAATGLAGGPVPVPHQVCLVEVDQEQGIRKIHRWDPESRAAFQDPLPCEPMWKSSPDPGLAVYAAPDGTRVALQTSLKYVVLKYPKRGPGGFREVPSVPSERSAFPMGNGYADPACFSPDGAFLAFTGGGLRKPVVPHSIQVCDYATGGTRVLAEHARNASWCPDGQWIAYARLEERRPGSVKDKGIFKIRADGSGTVRLSRDYAQLITWSPKGSFLACGIHEDGILKDRDAIVVIRSDGTPVTEIPLGRVPHQRGLWSWLPDESGLVYIAGDGASLQVLGLSGGLVTPRVIARADPEGPFTEACVSPDGSFVYVLTAAGGGRHHAGRVPVGGGEVERIVDAPRRFSRLFMLSLPSRVPLDEATRAEAVGWIRRLGDSRHDAREEAHRRLERLGGRLYPLLKEEAERADDPEIRTRLEQILERLD